jgi:serine/threonine protein kinase
MGVVLAAYDPRLDRKVALKLLKSRVSAGESQSRLGREARALAKLSHPNVVQIYDVGEFEGRVFLAMEFVEGETLADWMRGPHEIDEIIAMFADAGRGLAAAHEAGVIHRDFKPDNVLVGHDRRPRVLDFGLARPIQAIAVAELEHASLVPDGEPASFGTSLDQLLRTGELSDADPRKAARLRQQEDPDSTLDAHVPQFAGDDPELSQDAIDTQSNDLPAPLYVPQSVDAGGGEDEDDHVITRTGALIGTPAYMSPEQFAGGQVDAASDQFAFCIALHQALYGHRPFIGKSSLELGRATAAGKIIDAPPNTRVPSWLRGLLLRGLSPKGSRPARRLPAT